jgi:hypothetical protein
MAGSGEHRMLFDVRGRRKHVIRVVYAILALLMAGSLFLTVGPFNIGELVGTGGGKSAGEVLEEQAERIEHRLARSPNDPALLLALTRTRIFAANDAVEEDPTTGTRTVTPEAKANFEAAAESWQRYLKEVGKQPNPNAAQLMGTAYVSLAESGSRTISEAEENLKSAAEAQRIVAEARPSLGSLSTLAIYEYYANDFAAGDRAAREAAVKAGSKAEVKNVETQLAAYRKRGKQWEKQRKKYAKQAAKTGKEKLQNPLGGLSGSPTGLTP